ncbi:MAG: ornithine carbamoyltransferase [Brevefilum sp.]|nr:ornithine carbamoyltransferase [Brevefilum sp.]MDT8380794.1 ornithine carbamoyltransferase [Brevefilum sp.]MDW7753619.1 ornithine carbamoyltransferase [Brevefilum sp.]
MKHFLDIADFSQQEINELLDLSVKLKKELKSGIFRPILKNKVLAMVFQKPSLRTRVSFDMAMRTLGGDALYLSPQEIGLGKRESIADVARVLSGYVQVIMARVFSHDHILELAKWSQVPVINGLSDYNHPCQAMADALTIYEEFGDLTGRTVSYIGDGNNVAVSLMKVVTKLGADFRIANPEDYDMPESDIQLGKKFAAIAGGSVTTMHDPKEAAEGADVIYTDTWTSMGQEEEAKKREKVFPPYQVNQSIVNLAKPEVIVMHCLPAHRGQEITDEVADGPHSRLFEQAENRMHAQKAILVDLLGGDHDAK